MMCNVPDLCAGMCTLSYTLSGGAGGGDFTIDDQLCLSVLTDQNKLCIFMNSVFVGGC